MCLMLSFHRPGIDISTSMSKKATNEKRVVCFVTDQREELVDKERSKEPVKQALKVIYQKIKVINIQEYTSTLRMGET